MRRARPSASATANPLIIRVLAALLLLGSAAARAPVEQADALVNEGVALGEAGRYREAITRFHDADRVLRRPIHDCNIALAYIGLESTHRAWFYLDRCRREASEALPDWVETQYQSLMVRLGAGGHGLLAIDTSPPGAELVVSVLDEEARVRAPVQLWVPLGGVEVRAHLAGFVDAREQVVVESGAPPALRLVLAPPPPAVRVVAIEAPPSAVEPVPEPADTTLAWVGVGGGAAALVGGFVVFLLALDSQEDAQQAHDRGDQSARDAANDDTRLREGLAYGLWGVGAASLGTGLWWLIR